jgi:hypothetical protein
MLQTIANKATIGASFMKTIVCLLVFFVMIKKILNSHNSIVNSTQ